jgi:DNA recombination protein RmuC
VIGGLAIGLLLGALGAAFAVALMRVRTRAQLAGERVQQGVELAAARAEAARLQGALDYEHAAGVERQAAAEDVRRQLAGEFATLSRQALEHNTAQFLELADTRLANAQQAARGDLDQRRRSIEELLTPLRDQLGRYEQSLRQLELDRQGAYSGLTEQVKLLSQSQEKLQSETRNLVTALRSPATRGRWGEMQLRRVVEMAGMLEHCDFDEQVTVDGEDGRVRPDVVVHLPGGKQVVVDAKVPLQAFLDANDAGDDDGRRAQLQAHARQLRSHVDSLSKKAYWREVEDAPDFVVAFVPGDPLLAAALEHDSSLLEHAVASHVLLATPTTLIALLRTVAYSWQQQSLAENARDVQRIGRELYKRLSTFGDHMARTGRSLNSAVDAYNKAVGSLERTVMPQARRFHELGVVGGADKELPDIDHVDAVARALQSPELGVGSRGATEGALELIEGSRAADDDLPDAATR